MRTTAEECSLSAGQKSVQVGGDDAVQYLVRRSACSCGRQGTESVMDTKASLAEHPTSECLMRSA